jgi:hypothetical protein
MCRPVQDIAGATEVRPVEHDDVTAGRMRRAASMYQSRALASW